MASTRSTKSTGSSTGKKNLPPSFAPGSIAWRTATRLKLDPNKVYHHLVALKKRLGRDLTATDILEDAKKPKSPLHAAPFLWDDDASAAEKYRMSIATMLVNSLVIYVEVSPSGPTVPIRAFANVTPGGRAHYAEVQEAFARTDGTRNVVMLRLLNRLEAIQNEFAHLSEFAEVFEVIERTKQKLRQKTAPQPVI